MKISLCCGSAPIDGRSINFSAVDEVRTHTPFVSQSSHSPSPSESTQLGGVAGFPGIPLPVKVTDCATVEFEVVNVSVAVFAPTVVGWNSRLTVQVPPAGREPTLLQGLVVISKSGVLLKVTDVTLNAVVPELISETFGRRKLPVPTV